MVVNELGLTLWDQLSAWAQAHQDFAHPVSQNHTYIWHVCYQVTMMLKATHPHYITQVISMFLPTTVMRGVSDLCPGGLGNPIMEKFSDELPELLLERMLADDDEVKHLNQFYRSPLPQMLQAGLSQFQGSSSDSQSSKSLSKSSSQKSLISNSQSQSSQSESAVPARGMAIIDHAECLVTYLLKKDPKQADKADDFRMMSFKAIMRGAIEVCDINKRNLQRTPITDEVRDQDSTDSKAGTKTLKGWSALRKMLKASVYRHAQLKPQPSDTDFVPSVEELIANRELVEQIPEVDATIIVRFVEEYRECKSVPRLCDFMKNNAMSQSTTLQCAAAMCVTHTLVKIMPKVTANGGKLDDAKSAFTLLAACAAEQIIELSDTWDVAYEWIQEVSTLKKAAEARIRQDGGASKETATAKKATETATAKALETLTRFLDSEPVAKEAVEMCGNKLVSPAIIFGMRARLVAHIMHDIGNMAVLLKEPGTPGTPGTPPTFAPPLVQSLLGQLRDHFTRDPVGSDMENDKFWKIFVGWSESALPTTKHQLFRNFIVDCFAKNAFALHQFCETVNADKVDALVKSAAAKMRTNALSGEDLQKYVEEELGMRDTGIDFRKITFFPKERVNAIDVVTRKLMEQDADYSKRRQVFGAPFNALLDKLRNYADKSSKGSKDSSDDAFWNVELAGIDVDVDENEMSSEPVSETSRLLQHGGVVTLPNWMTLLAGQELLDDGLRPQLLVREVTAKLQLLMTEALRNQASPGWIGHSLSLWIPDQTSGPHTRQIKITRPKSVSSPIVDPRSGLALVGCIKELSIEQLGCKMAGKMILPLFTEEVNASTPKHTLHKQEDIVEQRHNKSRSKQHNNLQRRLGTEAAKVLLLRLAQRLRDRTKAHTNNTITYKEEG